MKIIFKEREGGKKRNLKDYFFGKIFKIVVIKWRYFFVIKVKKIYNKKFFDLFSLWDGMGYIWVLLDWIMFWLKLNFILFNERFGILNICYLKLWVGIKLMCSVIVDRYWKSVNIFGEK